MKNKILLGALAGVMLFAVLTQLNYNELHSEKIVLNERIKDYEQEMYTVRILVQEKEQVITEQEEIILAQEQQLEAFEEQLKAIEEEEMKRVVVFDANDLRKLSNATVEDLKYVLKGTKLEHLASAYVQLEKDYGWNALAAAALTAHESYWGKDYKATSLCNIGGIRLKNGTYRDFTSQEECIDYIGSLLNRKYFNEEDDYFRGYGLKDVNILYCPNDGLTWSKDIISIATGFVNKINERGNTNE